jgi:(p)ppGpp synthase/HD superfamily hydrolase
MNNSTTAEQLIAKARQVATYAHAGQKRKGTGEPYVTHPDAVAEIVARYTSHPEAIAAAELHDVLEDVPSDRYSEAQMLNDFGPRVVELVKNVSENKRADDTVEKSWQDRKRYYLDHLSDLTDHDALIIAAADKIHNLTAMVNDYRKIGNDLWHRFNAPRDQQLWFYRSILDVVTAKNLSEDLVSQLRKVVDQFSTIVKSSD